MEGVGFFVRKVDNTGRMRGEGDVWKRSMGLAGVKTQAAIHIVHEEAVQVFSLEKKKMVVFIFWEIGGFYTGKHHAEEEGLVKTEYLVGEERMTSFNWMTITWNTTEHMKTWFALSI